MPLRRRSGILLAVAFVVTAGIRANLRPALDDWHSAQPTEQRDDIVDEQERLYISLIPWLPAQGRIGYLQPVDWPGEDAVRRFYLAEYALTPRLVVMGSDAEFVIVTPNATIESDRDPAALRSTDPRLAGFVLVRGFEGGVRLFRRLQ